MTSLQERKDRVNLIVDSWNAEKLNNYILRKKIINDSFNKFKFSLVNFISKALDIEFSTDDKVFLNNVNGARENRTNLTPNGAVVPKSEFALEYNIFLRQWYQIISQLSKNNPKLISKFRMTPNVRIKFGAELDDNIKGLEHIYKSFRCMGRRALGDELSYTYFRRL